MIKFKSLEYFIIHIVSFLCGIVLFYNIQYKILFSFILITFFKQIRTIVIFFILGMGIICFKLEGIKGQSWQNFSTITVEGSVKQIYFNNGSERFLVQDKNQNQHLIAIFANSPNLKLGDYVKIKGIFISLPDKVFPSFYDIKLKSQFSNIYGYIKVFNYDIIKRKFSILQHSKDYIKKILNNFKSENTKSVATAIFLGDKGKIQNQDYNTFKKAGLAHVLAISGLHMTVVCVLIFRFFFQAFAFTNLCLKYDTKKIASIVGISTGLFYLLLAGVPISGFRSFIMVFLTFLTFFSFGSLGIRSLAIAMFIILLIYPEELFFPSFQLSFVSVLCLLYSYQFNYKNKIIQFICSTVFSSFLISFATLPFIIYHFNYVHFYGILSNIIAIPLLIFFVIPLGLLSLLNIKIFIILFEYSIEVLFKIAYFTSKLPFSSIFFYNFNGYLLFVYSMCLILMFCFNSSKIKILSFIGLICIVIFYFVSIKKPLIIINQNYAVLRDENKYVSLFFMPEGFLKTVWEEKLNTKFIPVKDAQLKELKCEDQFCYSLKKNFFILFDDVEVLPFCLDGILINMTSNYKNFNCNFKKIITVQDLENKGQEPFVFY